MGQADSERVVEFQVADEVETRVIRPLGCEDRSNYEEPQHSEARPYAPTSQAGEGIDLSNVGGRSGCVVEAVDFQGYSPAKEARSVVQESGQRGVQLATQEHSTEQRASGIAEQINSYCGYQAARLIKGGHQIVVKGEKGKKHSIYFPKKGPIKLKLADPNTPYLEFATASELINAIMPFVKNNAGSATDVSAGSLMQLLDAQGRRCALSGRTLTPQTMSLDHKNPIASAGDHSIDNVQWVEMRINTAKGSLSNDEFIAICRDVASYNVDVR